MPTDLQVQVLVKNVIGHSHVRMGTYAKTVFVQQEPRADSEEFVRTENIVERITNAYRILLQQNANCVW
jgi:hypothetical protein